MARPPRRREDGASARQAPAHGHPASPAQLSGAEQQRVAIARALAKRPRVMLCDEPTGALDLKTGVRVLEALMEANTRFGTTLMIVTHNADMARLGDRVIHFADGLIRETLRNPARVPASEKIPRLTLLLPNGDILVAEGRGGSAPALRPKDVIAGVIKGKGTTQVESGDRLTLLRDADGDGRYELQTVFAENLNAPCGLALIENRLHVANQDELVRFDYTEGQRRARGEPVSVAPLPSDINQHWTKAMTAGPEGRFLYVGIGSNRNITERGMQAEQDRAVIWQIEAEGGLHKQYATGLRNLAAMAIHPETGQLWAVVNERDEMGPNLVPDYLTSVREGGFYGWPYSYWGKNVDTRVKPGDPQKVASAIQPDYSLGAHVAALGVGLSGPAMGPGFTDGAFVGMHGSWNRENPVGYKVVFVPFRNGRPASPSTSSPASWATTARPGAARWVSPWIRAGRSSSPTTSRTPSGG